MIFRRKSKRRQQIDRLIEAAKPPTCPHCGVAAYYHYCEALSAKLTAEREARNTKQEGK